MAAVQKISVTEAEKRFNAFGLPDYRLRNVTDLKVVFGHDVKLLKGYSDLTAEQQQLFDAFICNYYNCVGMGLKCGFVPKSIHYVEKITYCVSRPADEWNETPYKEVCAAVFNILLPDGKKRRFKFHNFYPEIPAEYWIDSSTEKFLRFDYKDGKRMDWLHVIEPEKWYQEMLDFGFYNMDCMEGMRQFPDKYFDLAIVDPPYGIGESGKKNGTRSKLATSKDYPEFYGEDKEPPGPEYFAELFRVSKNQVVWGANHFISRMPFDSSCWIVWDKETGNNDFADCELAWTSFSTAVRKYTFRWSGMLQGNMRDKEIRIHPTQKPVVLYEWILQKYAVPGAIILDTHVGSASSLIACTKLGFPYIGFEIHPGYYKKASERLQAETAQITIFNMEGANGW